MNSYIDHTLLDPKASLKDIQKICEEAIAYKFATVCIHPSFVEAAAEILNSSTVKVCTVIGFPLGATSTTAKVEEAKQAVKDGAKELDMVIHQGKLKEGEFSYVENDIHLVKQAVGDNLLKVILETCNLTDEEIAKGCQLAESAGADYVKTSTGFGSHGATFEAINLMKRNVSSKVKIKASGGIKDTETAKAYIDLGVSRIGASSGIAIIEGTKSTTNY